MTELTAIMVPDIGDFDEIEIIDVLVSVGDTIVESQDLITLESDKAAMEIPSTHAGVIRELKVTIGDKVKQGSVIAMIELTNTIQAMPLASHVEAEPEVGPVRPVKTEQSTTTAVIQSVSLPQNVIPVSDNADNKSSKTHVHASPSVRQFARELGVNLSLIPGSGLKGRITKQDVQYFVKQQLGAPANSMESAIPTVDFAKFGDTDTTELTRIKKISGKHLHACWLNIPHVTQFDEADITDMESFRQANKVMAAEKGINLTPLVFVLKVVVASLKMYPEFNSSLSDDKQNLIIKQYYNIGVAVDTPNGLMVPVIKDVDQKGFLVLASELAEISAKARDGILTAKALQGGTFSISSLGGIGGSFFTPIINAPEVAILGLGRHNMKPVWTGEEFVPRLMLPLSVSYDHRVIDGATGARFITCISQKLTDIRKVLL